MSTPPKRPTQQPRPAPAIVPAIPGSLRRRLAAAERRLARLIAQGIIKPR